MITLFGEDVSDKLTLAACVQIEKDTKWRPAYVRINIKKHHEFITQLVL